MKKNVLALSIAAMIGGLGFAGAASADVVVGTGVALTASTLTKTDAVDLVFAEGGIGHALLVPYFNAQNGNMTVMHVVNTDTVNGKAVKVRFRGALNSDDILDFQVFMSPGDVWTAAVTAGPDGVAQLVTSDTTCTLPKLTKGVNQTFVTDRLNGSLSAADKANNTREGYVEIFNMADIPPTTVNSTTVNTTLFATIKHISGVPTCSEGVLNATLSNFTTEGAAAAAGFNTPSTGLMGDWYIMNVAQTTTFSAGATAIRAVTTPGGSVSGRGNFVHFPQNANTATAPDTKTADPLFRTLNVYGAGGTLASAGTLPKIAAANYDLPDMSTPYIVAGTTAVSPLVQATSLTDALSVLSITNQYANDASISAKTDWVFSMPTRRYNVAANYSAPTTASNEYRIYTDLNANSATDERFTIGNTNVVNGAICVNSDGQTFWDREETSRVSGAVFSPGTVTQTRFCGETSVLSFADSGVSVLGASVARQNVSGIYVNGWSNVNVNNSNRGLPIIGHSFIKLSNPQATVGTSGTYGITWPHRFVRN